MFALGCGPELPDALRVVMAPLDRIARRCMEKDPEDRFQSARDVGYALEAYAGPASVPLSADDVRNMSGGADYDGPLMDYRAKGNKVEYAGKAMVEGREAYKLIVTMKDGQVRNDYVDCQTLLEIKWEGKLTFDGKQYGVESYFRDYRKVDGLMYAFHIDSETLGTPYKQKILFEKVEINPVVSEDQFGKPAL